MINTTFHSQFTFADAEKYLSNTAPMGKSVYGLGRINHLLEILRHPEHEFPCVTVVGTNGKGSTIAFLESLLRQHGVRTACHLKPHVESVTERLRVDGSDSTEDEFAASFHEIKQAVDDLWTREDRPTYFELIFAASLVHARNKKVDIALLEAGLGGRLDAVNAVDAILVIMTSISYDHTELLGNTLTEIAGEKICVVRPSGTLLTQRNPDEVMIVVNKYVREYDIDLKLADVSSLTHDQDGSWTYLTDSAVQIPGISLGLSGAYQSQNALLALNALELLHGHICPKLFTQPIIPQKIKDGMKSARLPARWETFHCEINGSKVIIDGGHNPDGLKSVFESFRAESGGEGVVIFGMKSTKDFTEILPSIVKSGRRIIFVPVPDLDSHSPGKLSDSAWKYFESHPGLSQFEIDCKDSIIEALEAELESGHNNDILVTGSLYLAGAARRFLRTERSKTGSGVSVQK